MAIPGRAGFYVHLQILTSKIAEYLDSVVSGGQSIAEQKLWHAVPPAEPKGDEKKDQFMSSSSFLLLYLRVSHVPVERRVSFCWEGCR